MKCLVMPSQTIGPFPHEAWRWAVDAGPAASAATIEISGRVTDGAGQPVNDAWLEFWAPEAARLEAHQDKPWPGFRRAPTDAAGGYRITFPAPSSAEPAIYVTIFSRGILTHLYTAVFVEDAPGLQKSELLQQIP